MKIRAVELYAYDMTYARGEYVTSKGRAVLRQASTLVRIVTDDGLEGWGETSTLGERICQRSRRARAPHSR